MAIHYYSTHNHIEPEYEYEYSLERAKPIYRAAQIIWGVLYVVVAFLLFRFGLRLVGANPAAPFVAFVYGVSGIFLAPFQYILPTARSGRSVLEWSTLIATLVYMVVAWLLVKLLAMARPVSPYEADSHLTRREAF